MLTYFYNFTLLRPIAHYATAEFHYSAQISVHINLSHFLHSFLQSFIHLTHYGKFICSVTLNIDLNPRYKKLVQTLL